MEYCGGGDLQAKIKRHFTRRSYMVSFETWQECAVVHICTPLYSTNLSTYDENVARYTTPLTAFGVTNRMNFYPRTSAPCGSTSFSWRRGWRPSMTRAYCTEVSFWAGDYSGTRLSGLTIQVNCTS